MKYSYFSKSYNTLPGIIANARAGRMPVLNLNSIAIYFFDRACALIQNQFVTDQLIKTGKRTTIYKNGNR